MGCGSAVIGRPTALRPMARRNETNPRRFREPTARRGDWNGPRGFDQSHESFSVEAALSVVS